MYPDTSSSSFTLTHGGPERVVDAEFAAVSGPDGDGIPAVVEDAAPNGGDGNGDGIADSAQNHVTSLPAATSGAFVTIAGPAGTNLEAVDSTSVVQPAPPNLEFPAGLLAFRVVGVAPGGSASVQVFLPPDVTPDAFWKYQNGGYLQFPDAVVAGNVVTLTLQDGGPFDEDGVANGVIVDPIAISDATAVGTTTSVSSTANPSSFGDPVTFTATVTPASGTADAVGTVTFTVDGVEQLAARRAARTARPACLRSRRWPSEPTPSPRRTRPAPEASSRAPATLRRSCTRSNQDRCTTWC